MDFVTKKIVGAAVLPIPTALLLLVIGLLLLFLARHVVLGKWLVFAGVLVLVVFSLPFFPDFMLKKLESQYRPMSVAPQNIGSVVVLGAGNGGYPHYPANDKLSAASLARLIEGIRIHKHIANSMLVLSGGRVFGSPPDADAMNNVASMLGVTPVEIKIENGSEDTFQEAINLKKIVGTKPFVLVTSAYHMPRAMRLFQHQGMHPIPAPTEFLLAKRRYTIKQYFPNATNLVYSDIAIHEFLGLLWSQWQGKI